MTDEPAAGVGARAAALGALRAIDGGEGANSALDRVLASGRVAARDRGLVTELVYGTTRMRRRCDAALEPHLRRPLDGPTRAALRLGAHQILHLDVPAHAAVSATVGATPRRSRGFVNAVLRRVAEHASVPADGAGVGDRLSYPDWIVDRLCRDVGEERALDALTAMNEPRAAPARPDGYRQGRSSREVVAALARSVPEGSLVADLCAAPGGKATDLAGFGGRVVALDRSAERTAVLAAVARRYGRGRVAVARGDAAAPALRSERFDAVLVDAPCTGLGVLGRRPDARWRVEPGAVGRLAAVQRDLLAAAAPLVRPGGVLAYCVCTMTSVETLEVDRWLEGVCPGWEALPGPEAPWQPHGRGALVVPEPGAGHDGMFSLMLRRP